MLPAYFDCSHAFNFTSLCVDNLKLENSYGEMVLLNLNWYYSFQYDSRMNGLWPGQDTKHHMTTGMKNAPDPKKIKYKSHKNLNPMNFSNLYLTTFHLSYHKYEWCNIHVQTIEWIKSFLSVHFIIRLSLSLPFFISFFLSFFLSSIQ